MIFDVSKLLLFIPATIVLVMIPGPAVIYIIACSLGNGRKAAIVSAAGVAAGGLVHVAAAALGLSALLVSSAVAFAIIKYLGAVYLIYLGVIKLFEKPARDDIVKVRHQSPGQFFRQGFIVQVLNPKVALFFLSFLPQFVTVIHGRVVQQTLFFGLLFVLIAFIGDSAYALFADRLKQRLVGARASEKWPRWSGLLYLLLGVGAALTDFRSP